MATHGSFLYYSRFPKTELHIRTDSRIAILDGKIDAANEKNIEDGMVEMNMNVQRILEELNRMQHSARDSVLIPQDQETFTKVGGCLERGRIRDPDLNTVGRIARLAVFSF